MPSSKLMKLFSALKEATERGEVRWEDTAAENVFRVWIGDSAVKLAEEYAQGDDDSPAPHKYYVASILNARDEVVDEVEVWSGPEYGLLARLYADARRNAKQADKLVDEMLRALTQKQ